MTDETQGSAEGASVTSITIQGASFDVPAPYVEGQAITANEAAALNQVRAENVRNNAAGKIKKALADHVAEQVKAGATPEAAAESFSISDALRSEILAYAADYQFGARQARTTEPVDPVEREALRIAKETLNEALRKNGKKAKDLPEGQYDAMAKELSGRENILKEAKRRVKAKSDIGAEALSFDAPPAEADATA